MKKEYVTPTIEGEAFLPNEYIAACYSGTCNVDCGDYYVWNDNNMNGQYDQGEDGNYVASGNLACKAKFNEEGTITPVVWFTLDFDGRKLVKVPHTGWYFVARTPHTGWTSTHVTTNYTETNSST